jgi:hypothetical protein
MRLRVRPLPANQRVTACLILRSTVRTIVRMSWVRTCSGAGQILLLARRLPIGITVARRRKGLPIGTVHGRRRSDAAPDGVRRDEGLRLGGDGGEDAVLVEPHAVGAAAIFSRLEARAPDLRRVSKLRRAIAWAITYLATSAVAAGNGGALAGSWRLVVLLLHILRWWWRLLAVRVLRRRSARPLIGARQAIWLLLLVVRMLGHVGSRLLGRWRERGVHLG